MKGPAGCDRMIEFKTYLLALHRASSWWFQIFFIFRSHFGSSFISIGSPCIGCENQLQLRMQPRKSQGPQPPQMVLAYPGRPQTFTVPMSYSTMLPSAPGNENDFFLEPYVYPAASAGSGPHGATKSKGHAARFHTAECKGGIPGAGH